MNVPSFNSIVNKTPSTVFSTKPATGNNDMNVPHSATTVTISDHSLSYALHYYHRGFSIVPQAPEQKHPSIKWKPFQTQRPSLAQVCAWWAKWPDAGIAVILGPLSGLFAIDVDGEAAHLALVSKLGAEPLAPKVISGSRKPFRYHLFFRYPDQDVSRKWTKAKATPWHPNLEFRGHNGILILPPSLHKSGNRYEWAEGQSLNDLDPPELPEMVSQVLQETQEPSQRQPSRPSGRKSRHESANLTTVQKRARTYLSKMKPAIQGQGGDKQTYSAACRLVIDFALSPEQAFPVLLDLFSAPLSMGQWKTS